MNDFETYCLKERHKQLYYKIPFSKVFGIRLFTFFTKVVVGFDVVAFDKWLKPKENQSTYEAVFERFGQEGVDLLKKLVE